MDCQYEKCPSKGLVILSTTVQFVDCTHCQKTMHVRCVVEHNKMVSHVMRTNGYMERAGMVH